MLSSERKVDPIHARVLRAGRSADWRDWFTPDDVDFFPRCFAAYLDEYGYENEWALAINPVISAAHSTDYVQRLVSERFATLVSRRQRSSDLLPCDAHFENLPDVIYLRRPTS